MIHGAFLPLKKKKIQKKRKSKTKEKSQKKRKKKKGKKERKKKYGLQRVGFLFALLFFVVCTHKVGGVWGVVGQEVGAG